MIRVFYENTIFEVDTLQLRDNHDSFNGFAYRVYEIYAIKGHDGAEDESWLIARFKLEKDAFKEMQKALKRGYISCYGY